MQIKIITVPYDSGYREKRQGLGPLRFMDEGLEQSLISDGHEVSAGRIDTQTQYTTEITSAFELNRELSIQVKTAVESGFFPLVLAGNCNTCLGSIGGMGSSKTGVVWFDAHGEFNTPETTLSGFLDGMPLSMLTGRCWQSLLKTIPGFEPIPDSRIMLVGAKDLDRAEEERFDRSQVTVVRGDRFDRDEDFELVSDCLQTFLENVDGVYLHIDLDILDYGGVYANHLKISGGMKPVFLEKTISLIKQTRAIKACTMASYDPANDRDGVVVSTGIQLLRHVIGKM